MILAKNKQLQIAVISLRVIDLLLRIQFERGKRELQFKLPFRIASNRENDPGCHEVINSMLSMGYVCEAQTLLPICLRHARSEDKTALLDILKAIPTEDDSVHTLVRCRMLVELSSFFASQSWQISEDVKATYAYWRGRVEGALDSSRLMDSIVAPTSESRAYQEWKLFHLSEEEKRQNSSSSAKGATSLSRLEIIRAKAKNHDDYMLELATYEQSEDPLPPAWLQRTGTSKEALEYLHPNAQRSRRMQPLVTEPKAPSPTISFLDKFFAVLRMTLVAAIKTVISSAGEDGILEIAWTVFRKATQKAILTTITIIFKTIVYAMIGYIGPVNSIWKAIIDNPANQELFETLERDWWKVACFFIDILEPMKSFVRADSTDFKLPPAAAAWNQYNELDLTQPMNRHAVISQIQRFFKSVIEVFRQADLNVSKFDMNTQLDTDSKETLVTTVALGRRTGLYTDAVETPESWIFVNGIAGEFYWNHLSMQKLQDFFFDPDRPEDTSEEVASRRTTITGVFNRSNGIVWDLIECAGERHLPYGNTGNMAERTSKPTLSSHTASSREAQGQLAQLLRRALSDSETSKRDIIMIAHSQGCLLLRLALEQIHSDTNEKKRNVMRTHLRIFTFGNPAYDWDVHAYTASTEHFANELDYVAKLGVLRRFSSGPSKAVDSELDYCSKCKAGDDKHLLMPKQLIFVNKRHQTGHLFGSQYSLQVKDYDCVNSASESRLLSRAFRRP